MSLNTETSVRVRFAPSPTGVLHVGGARTALFNYLFAKAKKGKFILRIEDTDQARSSATATKQVLQALKWLKMDWDEGPEIGGAFGPYFQKERKEIYNRFFEKLVAKNKAYPCYCSPEELGRKRARMENVGRPYIYDGLCRNLTLKERQEKESRGLPKTLRFRVDPAACVSFEDLVRGKVRFETKLIGDFVIKKSDGFPTYNFAVVVDDGSMQISHVIRGDDHISNTPRQLLLYKALQSDFSPPQFAHISMILNSNNQKLSKRDGAVDIMEFKEKGYLNDPLINHLALLGWSPADGVEVIPREKLKCSFVNLKFSASPAIFSYGKLDYFNGLYIRNLAPKSFLAIARNFLIQHHYPQPQLDHPRFDAQLLQIRSYCKKLGDLPQALSLFFAAHIKPEEALLPLLQAAAKSGLFTLAISYFSQKTADFIAIDEFENFSKLAQEKLKIKGKLFFKPLRIKLTGSTSGIELKDFFTLVYRKTIIERLEQ